MICLSPIVKSSILLIFMIQTLEVQVRFIREHMKKIWTRKKIELKHCNIYLFLILVNIKMLILLQNLSIKTENKLTKNTVT